MTPELWNVILVGLVVLLAGYALYTRHKSGQVTDLSTLVATVEEQLPLATELQEVAQIVVNEIEQAAREGEYITNDEKLARAINLVKGWRPEFAEVETTKIISAIKSAVLVASTLTNAIKADKAVQADAERKGLDVN